MGHHLTTGGFFQSDKHPELPVHKIMLDFRDIHAQKVLLKYAKFTDDKELADDIRTAIKCVREAGLSKKPD